MGPAARQEQPKDLSTPYERGGAQSPSAASGQAGGQPGAEPRHVPFGRSAPCCCGLFLGLLNAIRRVAIPEVVSLSLK